MTRRSPRSPTLPARLTRPLAFADEPLNALQDRLNAAMPWVWWPLGRPNPRRPLPASAHLLAAVHIVGGTMLPEPLLRAFGGDLPTGGRLWGERLGSVLLSAALWIVAAGAWDRRARRRWGVRILGLRS